MHCSLHCCRRTVVTTQQWMLEEEVCYHQDDFRAARRGGHNPRLLDLRAERVTGYATRLPDRIVEYRSRCYIGRGFTWIIQLRRSAEVSASPWCYSCKRISEATGGLSSSNMTYRTDAIGKDVSGYLRSIRLSCSIWDIVVTSPGSLRGLQTLFLS